jgi:hypothetical protein
LFAIVGFSLVTSSLGADPQNSLAVIDVSFTRHVDFPVTMPIQDVYIVLNESTPVFVYRVDPASAMDRSMLSKMACATTNHSSHDPLMQTANPLGPFRKRPRYGIHDGGLAQRYM